MCVCVGMGGVVLCYLELDMGVGFGYISKSRVFKLIIEGQSCSAKKDPNCRYKYRYGNMTIKINIFEHGFIKRHVIKFA